MKITIAYLPEWETAANAFVEVAQRMLPGIKVRESDRHAPFKHIYLTIRKPKRPCVSKENT